MSTDPAVPTIVLYPGATAPSYRGLRVAAIVLRVIAAVAVVYAGFWAIGLFSMPFPFLLMVLYFGAGAALLWGAAELCDLAVEGIGHLRRLTGSRTGT